MQHTQHVHVAQDVLVFDGGHTVKLANFSTAVAVGEVTSIRDLKDLNPYFAAPELIKGVLPKPSADIWSVLCILIEMLTASQPGCHQVTRNEAAMMFLVNFVRGCMPVCLGTHIMCMVVDWII